MAEICVFVGAATAFNVRRTVSDLGWTLGDDHDLSLVTTSPGAFDDEARRYVAVDDRTRTPNLRGEVGALSDHLRHHEPDAVVQVTRPPRHGLVAGSLAARHGVPFVYRYSGDRFYVHRVVPGWRGIANFGLNNVVGRVPLHLADLAIVLGPTGRRRVVARGVDPDHVAVLPPAVDLAQFRAAEPAELDVPPDRSVALFLGRLSRLKGGGFVERTIPAVCRERDDLDFVFVGPADRKPVVTGEFADRVHVVGPVEPDAVPSYLAAADVLVHASLTDGLPRVLLEALAAGTPVVARDVGEVSSVTTNVYTEMDGFLGLVTEFEDLPLDDVEPFSRTALRERYLSAIDQVV